MLRTFLAIRIDPHMEQAICSAQSQLEHRLTGIRWMTHENLHLTLKFLGSTEESKINPVAEAIAEAVSSTQPFSFTGRGIGFFPDIKRARVLWVGLEGSELKPLAEEVEKTLEPLGFAREKRGFVPHLTIGRWRQFFTQANSLKEEMERWKDHDFGCSTVEEVVLFQSVLKPAGAVYSPLRVIPVPSGSGEAQGE